MPGASAAGRRPWPLALASIAAASAACAACYRPDPAEGLACSPVEHRCPDGQECVGDLCVLTGSAPPDAEVCPATTCDVEVLSSEGGSADAITAAHPDFLFWTSRADRRLFRTGKLVPLTDVVDEGVSPYAPLGVAAVAGTVYWSDSRTSGAILSHPAAGGGAAEPLASGQDFPLYLATDAAHVYWTNAGGLVLRAELDGGGLTMVATSPGDGPAGALVVDGEQVYFADNGGGRVLAIAADGGDELATIASEQGGPLGVGVDAAHVYWTNGASGEVVRRALAGGAPELVASGQEGASFLAVGPGHVYWTNRTDGRVMSADKTTLDVAQVTDGQDAPYGLALDGQALYWVNQEGPNRVSRIYPCACR